MNVYLVDDSMEMIHSMKEALTKSDGYQVIGEYRNRRSVSMSCGKHLDVLVLDLIMPKKDGISVLHDLKKNHIQVDPSSVQHRCERSHRGRCSELPYRLYSDGRPFEIEQLCDKLNFIVGYTFGRSIYPAMW